MITSWKWWSVFSHWSLDEWKETWYKRWIFCTSYSLTYFSLWSDIRWIFLCSTYFCVSDFYFRTFLYNVRVPLCFLVLIDINIIYFIWSSVSDIFLCFHQGYMMISSGKSFSYIIKIYVTWVVTTWVYIFRL